MKLKYVGGGFLRGIPKRDLSDAEVEKHGGEEFLVGTGLYTREKSDVIVNQYFAGAKINLYEREQQAPAAPKQSKKSKPVVFNGSVTDVTKGDEIVE